MLPLVIFRSCTLAGIIIGDAVFYSVHLITVHSDVDFQNLRWNLWPPDLWTLKLLLSWVMCQMIFCSCINMPFFFKCFPLVLISIENCWYCYEGGQMVVVSKSVIPSYLFLYVRWHSTKRKYFLPQLFPTYWHLSLGLIHYFFIEWDIIYYCDYFALEIDCSRFDQCDRFKLIPLLFVCVHIVSDLIRKFHTVEAYFYTM